MKILNLLVFMLGLHLHLFSQATSVPGYIITTKNDTIQGEVKVHKNDMDYYVKVFFRDKPVGGFKQYLPAKIHGYGMEGQNYFAIKLEYGWVFVQVICWGKINLYEYKPPTYMGNERKESIYLIAKGSQTEVEQIFPDSKVKKQLKQYISDDKELYDNMPDALDYAGMVQVIEEYNRRNAG